MGRRKIEIQPLTDGRNRVVTFVKRKAGLFKKAHELAVLCQVDLAVIIIGNNNKVYEFSSVEMKELLDYYLKVKKPYESKSPANYGNYKKRKHLQTDDRGMGDYSMEENMNESEFESDSVEPEPKRAKRSKGEEDRLDEPDFYPHRNDASPYLPMVGVQEFQHEESPRRTVNYDQNTGSKDESSSVASGNQKPVLRLQIPVDVKNSNDSARTITAVDTKFKEDTNDNDQANQNSRSSTFERGLENRSAIPSAFDNTESRKVYQLPLPGQSKSQVSSPQSATAYQQPISGLSSALGPLPHPLSSLRFPNSATMGSTSFPQNLDQYNQFLQQSQPLQSQPQQLLQKNLPEKMNPSLLRQNQNQNQNQAQNQNQPNSVIEKIRHSGLTPSQLHFQGEQTPLSSLPSRYINDIFPSPSNLYLSQDWPPPGITPLNPNAPSYFPQFPPSAGVSGHDFTQNTLNPAGSQNRSEEYHFTESRRES